jgi:superfamily II DNA/RNA helicase
LLFCRKGVHILLSLFLEFIEPTAVQKTVIPRILNKENLLLAASTGSGKTLAYILPCMQNMRLEEQSGYVRTPKRPRCLVLVPTRELARQVLQTVKQIGHHSKVASTAVLGGEQYAMQKKEVQHIPASHHTTLQCTTLLCSAFSDCFLLIK